MTTAQKNKELEEDLRVCVAAMKDASTALMSEWKAFDPAYIHGMKLSIALSSLNSL